VKTGDGSWYTGGHGGRLNTGVSGWKQETWHLCRPIDVKWNQQPVSLFGNRRCEDQEDVYQKTTLIMIFVVVFINVLIYSGKTVFLINLSMSLQSHKNYH